MSLLSEMKAYKPRASVQHKTNTIELSDLVSKLRANEKFVLNKLDETSSLHIDAIKPQYELLQVNEQTKEISHIKLKTGQNVQAVGISDMIQEFIQTGNITIRNASNTNMHNIPIPGYTVEEYNNTKAPVVKLKNGRKAIIVNGEIIEGATLQ